MGQGRVPVFRVFGKVGDAVAVAPGAFRYDRHAGRHEVAAGDQGNVHGFNLAGRLQGKRDGRQGVIIRDDEFGARSAVVVVRDHPGRPVADGLKEAAKRITGGVPRNQHLVIADAQFVVRRMMFCQVQHTSKSIGQADFRNDAVFSAGTVPYIENRLPFTFEREAVCEIVPRIGKDNSPGTGTAAVNLFNAGYQSGKDSFPVLGDGDSIELMEGQDLVQGADGINRGDGGGGKTFLVVGQARRLEGQQVIDGDFVIPAT